VTVNRCSLDRVPASYSWFVANKRRAEDAPAFLGGCLIAKNRGRTTTNRDELNKRPCWPSFASAWLRISHEAWRLSDSWSLHFESDIKIRSGRFGTFLCRFLTFPEGQKECRPPVCRQRAFRLPTRLSRKFTRCQRFDRKITGPISFSLGHNFIHTSSFSSPTSSVWL